MAALRRGSFRIESGIWLLMNRFGFDFSFVATLTVTVLVLALLGLSDSNNSIE